MSMSMTVVPMMGVDPAESVVIPLGGVGVAQTGAYPYRCPIRLCQWTFSNLPRVMQHMDSQHHLGIEETRVPGETCPILLAAPIMGGGGLPLQDHDYHAPPPPPGGPSYPPSPATLAKQEQLSDEEKTKRFWETFQETVDELNVMYNNRGNGGPLPAPSSPGSASATSTSTSTSSSSSYRSGAASSSSNHSSSYPFSSVSQASQGQGGHHGGLTHFSFMMDDIPLTISADLSGGAGGVVDGNIVSVIQKFLRANPEGLMQRGASWESSSCSCNSGHSPMKSVRNQGPLATVTSEEVPENGLDLDGNLRESLRSLLETGYPLSSSNGVAWSDITLGDILASSPGVPNGGSLLLRGTSWGKQRKQSKGPSASAPAPAQKVGRKRKGTTPADGQATSKRGKKNYTPVELSPEDQQLYSYEYIMQQGVKNRAVKDKTTPFICPVPGCGKVYKNPNGLKYHAKHGHVPSPPPNPTATSTATATDTSDTTTELDCSA